MSDRVEITVAVNTVDAEASIEAVKAKSDTVVKEWRIRRLEIIQGVREAVTLLSQAWSTFNQFMRLAGAQIDPFYSALIGMTLSTVSMLLSMSTALAMTGIGAVAAIIIGSIAVSLNVLLLGKLIVEKAEAMELFGAISRGTELAQQRGGLF